MDTEQQQQPALEVVEPAPAEVLEPEQPQEEAPPAIPQTPQTSLTFLLVSGRRRTMAFDPDTTVGRVKELVWNAWPSEPEWQAERPPAPAYLRILYLGKILQDEDTLAKLSFPSHTPPSPSASPKPAPPPTIVHLSIRAYAPPADDALKKKKSARRRGNTTSASAGGWCPAAAVVFVCFPGTPPICAR
ncbi:hypothetical protein B0H16DRAFT_662080 [Mycena metata]|uniref:Ubiquitin-like domain-containing protein n=1 Tax=Mycena metata TaxID=1033252 RepID=A0AAD7GZ41_9AGAR|nr:hypothetical protein B0H16DRAFT_662080 [Mycena metata]